jgi:hypothetical protein
MWEHFDDLPFEVFCVDNKGERHLLRRHRLESEAIHSMNAQNRSGGYAAEYHDWRAVAMSCTPKKCVLCNGCGTAQGCAGCHKVDPYLRAYAGSLVNDETGNPNS